MTGRRDPSAADDDGPTIAVDGATPRQLAARLESAPTVPDIRDAERFRGFGVIGVPFASGDLLAMRRFPASSVGPGYTSVWHRSPTGRWTFYQDQDPLVACPRAFGPAIDDAVTTDISLDWTAPDRFVMEIEQPIRLRWTVGLNATPATRVLSAIVSAVPTRLRRSGAFAAVAGRAAGVVLRAGRLRLVGEAPSGQRFHADMRRVWAIDESPAAIDGSELGAIAPLPEQVHLGDFWIPQRGLFAFGDGIFDAYDPTQHVQAVTRN